ncbi:MAG: potassium channel family protein [Candidatus Desulforudis sp.]|nr:potassium channel family protein [Desulforudis sp.]
MPASRWEKLRLPYELTMIALAVMVAYLVVKEMTGAVTEEELWWYRRVDWIILALFATDYFTRLYLARDKKAFVKGNIPDLIAIIPFDSMFRLARLVRLVRLFRLLRVAVILRRFSGTLMGIFRTNGLSYVAAATVAIIVCGAMGIQYFERDTGHIEGFGDALWWSLVTTTTVGYGDISPESIGGRFLAGFLMIVGIGFLGMLTGTIATYFLDQLRTKETKSLDQDIKDLIKSKIDELENLSQDDRDQLIKLIKAFDRNTPADDTRH